jgi:outer membrane murein-binding lipoprotein Lpp
MGVSEDSPDAAVETLAENYARVRAEVTRLVAEVATLTAERDELREEVRGLKGVNVPIGQKSNGLQDTVEALAARLAQAERVVEAARAWRPIHGSKHDPCDPGRCGQRTCALTRAVDALDGTAGPGEEHRYLSTACLHAAEPGRVDLHRECQVDARRYDGTHKVRATCKWCPARCICACHVGLGEDNNE